MAPDLPAFGVYSGVVTHVRHRPVRHALRYRMFMLLIDLDEAATVLGRLRMLSSGRFSPLRFREADHGDGGDRPLVLQVRERLRAAGVAADGPIRLLTMPRVLGHGFNPLSLYLCHDADGRLAATLYEVSNTFGQRHSYLVPVEGTDDGVIRQTVEKRFYVSPFMDMDLTYRFLLRPPSDSVRLVIDVDDGEGAMLTAGFVGRGRPLTDANLLAAWLADPLLTLKVVAGIHKEALMLSVRGLRLRPRPSPPAGPVTIGRPIPRPSPAHGEKAHAA